MARTKATTETHMTHVLDGARLKIIRAQEHLESLKAEIRMYLSDHPHEIVTEQKGQDWTIHPIIKVAPPIRLSTIIGDCVTNARAALDYIAWQLANRHFITLLPDDRRWVSFPIYENTADAGYVNKINRFSNRKIPTAAIQEIQAVQPNNAGYRALWWLHELVNADKHRLPILTVGRITVANVRIIRRLRGTSTMLYSGTLSGGSLTITDSTFPASGPTGDDGMEMNGQTVVFVAFQDVSMPREPVERTLEQIIETVSNVIPRFDQFF